MNKKCFTLALFVFISPVYSGESVEVMDELMSTKKSPRPITSEDVGLSSKTPLPLQPLQGEFNGDGVTDHAISGVYNLPGPGLPYFLLVASERSGYQKAKLLFFREYDKPVFLHSKGSTGEADPGTQNFSISFCQDCDQGLDFYWDKKNQSFFQKTWSSRVVKSTKIVETKIPDVPTEKVNLALKVVGMLNDVQTFINSLKKKGVPFKTRVEPLANSPEMDRVRVIILEGKKEKLWDDLEVDLTRNEILNRRRKVKRAGQDKS